MTIHVTHERTFSEHFCDPYDVATSFQLSSRLIGSDKLSSISPIRDADQALENNEHRLFLKLIKSVTARLTASQSNQIVNRAIYNHIYLCAFEPRIFSLPLSKQEGRFVLGLQPSLHMELGVNLEAIRKSLVKDSRKQFHALYGFDFSKSSMAIRYSKIIEPKAYGEGDNARQNHADAFFKDTNANFLHMDEKKGLTTILYLSNVSASNGAFRYVEGSHAAKISPTLKAIHEFIYNDLNITAHKDVMCFPPEFRAGINYYFWLEPEKQKIIDSFTRTLNGPAGTAITFAGNRLLHGGGIPYFHERSALFIQHIGYFFHRLRHLLHPASILGRAGYTGG